MADFATLPGGLYFGGKGADLVNADGDIPGGFDNLIATFGGSDTVHAGLGDDLVLGGDGDDQLFGDAGDDVLFGEKGKDTLAGGDGDDVLAGGDGHDVLAGDGGADTLVGGEGHDMLAGQGGADTYYFGSGFGKDVVLDFRPGEDVLAIQSNINDSGIRSAADLVSHIRDTPEGAVIKLGGDEIKLVGVSRDDLVGNIDAYVKIV